MADRDAKVRLNLAAAGFLTSLRELQNQGKLFAEAIEDIGEEGKKAEPKVSGLMSALKKGGDAAKDSLRGMYGELKNGLQMAVTLGGALSFGAAAKGAVELQSTYRDIAFAVQRSTGEAHKWEDIQQRVEATAGRWKQANGEVADSFGEIFKTTEDLDFTTKAVDAAGKASRATGASMQATTAIVSELAEKFGIVGDEIDGAMSTVVGMVPGGKKGLEELGDKLGLLGASARSVGLEGQAGLQKVLGMLNMAGATGGNFKKELGSVIQLLETLGDQDQAKAIEKKLGVKLRDKSGATKQDAIERIIIATEGRQEKLSQVFSGPLLRFTSELGRSYQKAYADTQGDATKKTTEALRAFRAAVEDASKSSLDAAAIEAQANDRLKDPKAQLTAALSELENAFTKPQMIAAIEKIAAVAPKAAEMLANLVEFATNHPLLAGAGYVGGRVGGAALESFAGDALSGLLGGGKIAGEAGAAGSAFAKAAFGAGVMAAAAAALGFGVASIIGDYMGQRAAEEEAAKQEREDEAARAKAKELEEDIVLATTGDQGEAVRKLGKERVDRYRRGDLQDRERAILEAGQAASGAGTTAAPSLRSLN